MERDVGSLEEFVIQLCSQEPGPPGSQILDVENANDTSELGSIFTQIWFNLYKVLQGDEDLMERYMLSMGVKPRFFRRNEEPANSDAFINVRIPWSGHRILRFEILRIY